MEGGGIAAGDARLVGNWFLSRKLSYLALVGASTDDEEDEEYDT